MQAEVWWYTDNEEEGPRGNALIAHRNFPPSACSLTHSGEALQEPDPAEFKELAQSRSNRSPGSEQEKSRTITELRGTLREQPEENQGFQSETAKVTNQVDDLQKVALVLNF